MKSLYSYMDYRQFLKDYFAEKKSSNKVFSYAVFAALAGFKARDYILRVMKGGRNLSKNGTYRLGKAMRLSAKETEYFENLVAYNQATSDEEKEHYFLKISENRKYGQIQILRKDQYAYLSQWYHCAIRSLLPVMNFNDDWEKLAMFLRPPITASQAKKSVALLLRLGLLIKTGKGRYVTTSSSLSTGDELRSIALTRFHKTTMDLAKKALENVPAPARDISGVTVSISAGGFNRIKEEVRSFRKQVLAIAAMDSREDRVCQVNIHLFPLSETRAS